MVVVTSSGAGRGNRGPSAAAGNRSALIEAAREVFGEQGVAAPLSAVAKRAGVGQGSLYRHFPDRISLALAAFDDNMTEIEALAALPGTTLRSLLARITELTIESVAFVDLLFAGTTDPRLDALTGRLREALREPLRAARRNGAVRRSLRTADVELALGMMAARVARAPGNDRERTAAACWALLDRALRP
jgi:AcrR family transcriptional regulator